MYRKKMNSHRDRKVFSRTAKSVHPRNNATVMRGGIRF